MGDDLLTVRCACGWEATGSEDDVVAETTDHGRTLHNMTPTREQVLAMAITPAGSAEAGEAAQTAE